MRDFIPILIILIICAICIVSMWKIFEKAGREGWKAIIPFYNLWVLAEMAGRPGWWSLLSFIPYAGYAVIGVLWMDVSIKFGKSKWFAIGVILLPFIFLPMLAFNKEVTYDSSVKNDMLDSIGDIGKQEN